MRVDTNEGAISQVGLGGEVIAEGRPATVVKLGDLRVRRTLDRAREGGAVAGVWDLHDPPSDTRGIASPEGIWAALDCPGVVARVIMGWPIERSGRELMAGMAMFWAGGDLLAQSRRIWIGRTPA